MGAFDNEAAHGFRVSQIEFHDFASFRVCFTAFNGVFSIPHLGTILLTFPRSVSEIEGVVLLSLMILMHTLHQVAQIAQ